MVLRRGSVEFNFYAVELVSAGCTEIIFHRLDLTDVTDQVAEQVKIAKAEDDDEDVEDAIVDESLSAIVNYEQQLIYNATQQERRINVVNQYLD